MRTKRDYEEKILLLQDDKEKFVLELMEIELSSKTLRDRQRAKLLKYRIKATARAIAAYEARWNVIVSRYQTWLARKIEMENKIARMEREKDANNDKIASIETKIAITKQAELLTMLFIDRRKLAERNMKLSVLVEKQLGLLDRHAERQPKAAAAIDIKNISTDPLEVPHVTRSNALTDVAATTAAKAATTEAAPEELFTLADAVIAEQERISGAPSISTTAELKKLVTPSAIDQHSANTDVSFLFRSAKAPEKEK